MIFIDWKDYASRSINRILSSLFSYLSSRWYPVNIIGSNTYNILKMYADQISSASIESFQLFNDLFIEGVRTTPFPTDRSSSKMYENFGYLFEVSKNISQEYEIHNYILQGYRQQLRFISEALFDSTTIKSIHQVGQAYNGVSPLVRESVRDVLGWKLQTVTGSILSIGDNLVILDAEIPKKGNLYYTNLPASVGDPYLYTYSKLGFNTKLLGKKRYNSGINCTLFLDSTIATSSIVRSIENSINNVLKVDIIPYYDVSDKISIWKPSPMSIPSHSSNLFMYASGGYIYNTQQVLLWRDPIYETDPYVSLIDIPSYKGALTSGYLGIMDINPDITYYYDWSVLLRNDARYKVYMRSYPGQPIPRTVYFREYLPGYNKFSLLSDIESSKDLQPINHLIFNKLNEVEDISTVNNLTLWVSGSFKTTYIRGREPLKLGWKLSSGSLILIYNDVASDLSQTNFLWEGWIYGIDTTFQGVFVYKYEDLPSPHEMTVIPENNGYSIAIESYDFLSGFFSFNINNSGSITTVRANISEYLEELPYRPHYFACLSINNVIYLQVDDNLIYSEQITGSIPSIPSGYLRIDTNSIGIGFDEIMLSTGSIVPGELRNRFYDTLPKITSRKIMNQDTIHQFQFRIEANAKEFELHQCSIRGVTTSSIPLPYFKIAHEASGYGDIYSEDYGIYL
jgi:hypothetical protein